MKQDFDFHVHTNASDGTLSPTQLIERAAREGVKTIALTDHDTVAGVAEALKAGEDFGVTVISGVEVSVDFSPGTMHVCGYFIDTKNKQFNEKLSFVQQARLERNPKVIEKLNDLGFDVSIDEAELEAAGGVVGRPHIARVLVKKGYVTDIKEAFDKYLAKAASCYADKKRLSAREAVDVIAQAGGFSVLAHPKQLGLENESQYLQLFGDMQDLGVAGIEAYSSCHSEKESRLFKSLADDLGMLVTGGSDFHGDGKPGVELGVFGDSVRIKSNILLKEMKQLLHKR